MAIGYDVYKIWWKKIEPCLKPYIRENNMHVTIWWNATRVRYMASPCASQVTPNEAEEILQETLIKACRAAKDFEGRARLSTWLFRIATNNSLMRLRKSTPPPSPWMRPRKILIAPSLQL